MSDRKTMGYKTPTADEINALIRAAHRERAKYVAELFSFGFASAEKGLAGFARKVEQPRRDAKPVGGCA